MRFYTLTLLLSMVFAAQPAFATDKSKGSCSAWQEECAQSKDPKSCFPGRCGEWGENDYLAAEAEEVGYGYGYGGDGSIDIHEGEQPKKSSQPVKKTKVIKKTEKTKKANKKKTSIMSCKTAFLAGQASPSTGEVMEAIEICKNAAQKVCAKNSDGTGDGRYVAAACMLNAAHKGYLAASKTASKFSMKCGNAAKEAMDSPSTSDLMEAAEICVEETEATCRDQAEAAGGAETGDGRLIGANCGLAAAHGGYIGVTTKEKKVADANTCGGKAEPRICKGSCFVNYECVKNKWEVSPIESCALCGDAAKGLDAIDIHEGESRASGAQ